MTTRKLFTRALAVSAAIAVLGAAVAGVQQPLDKSGDKSPVKLTLLNGDTTLNYVPAVRRFVDRVTAHSAAP